MNDTELHTDVMDTGEEICGIMFNPHNGQFYEFQNPEDHDNYAEYECPRTNDKIVHESIINHAIGSGMTISEPVNVNEWRNFRQTYMESEKSDIEKWEDIWEQITE